MDLSPSTPDQQSTQGDDTQTPGGFYYATYTSGGEYENALTKYGGPLASLLFYIGARNKTAKFIGGALDKLGIGPSRIGSFAGGTVGWYIDNSLMFEQNMETLMDQLDHVPVYSEMSTIGNLP